jgi:Zn-dependent protease with chaperone function
MNLMDSPTRNFLGLVGISATLAVYLICGFIAYVLIPLLGLSPGALTHLGPACLLPAFALTALLGTCIGLAARTLWLQTSASWRLSRRVRALALPPPPELSVAAKASGLDGRVTVLDSAELSSFVYGILVPRVAVGRGFLESLTAEELRAALEHERYHVRHLDPLRALLGKTLTEAFFLLPSLEVLRLRYEAGRELAADRRAERIFLLLLIAAVVGLGGTSALAGMAADELSASGTLLGVLCTVPVVAAFALVYRLLSRRAGEPLPSGHPT